jgi:hypothetical protein
MYWYYFRAACGKPPSWGKYITKLQIAQMVFGIFVTSAWGYYSVIINQCKSKNITVTLASAGLIYASYLVLFLQYYFQRWNSKKGEKSE